MPPLPDDGAPRLERKFTAQGLSAAEALAAAARLPGRFARAFPDRTVNSLYLDTPTRALLARTLEGAAERVKVRIRWYGPLEGEAAPTLELKLKRGLVGRKISCRLAPLPLRFPALPGSLVAAARASAAVPPAVREFIAPLKAAFINRYARAYLVSACGRFRLTLDREMEAFTPDGRPVGWPVPGRAVFELKYAPEHDGEAREIASRLPFRLDRHSKFVDATAAALARI